MANVRGRRKKTVVPAPSLLSSSMVPLSLVRLERTTSMPTPRPERSLIFSAVLKPGRNTKSRISRVVMVRRAEDVLNTLRRSGDWLLVGSCSRSVFSLSLLGLAVPAARSARQAPYLRHARFSSAWNCRGFKERIYGCRRKQGDFGENQARMVKQPAPDG